MHDNVLEREPLNPAARSPTNGAYGSATPVSPPNGRRRSAASSPMSTRSRRNGGSVAGHRGSVYQNRMPTHASLASYNFDKPEWTNLDYFASMSLVQQDLFYAEESTWSVSNRLWALLQLPVLVISVASLVAAAGIAINYSMEKLFYLRFYFYTEQLDEWWHCLGYLAFTLALALTACAITVYFCPWAAGGGIPEMKVVLSGSINPALLSVRLVVVKVLGIILALGAGLSVGKEGPLIHTACAISESFMKLGAFRRLKVNTPRRLEMLSCACAAGVAASFGSAFGATLFSVEVTATAYMVRGLPRAFLAAVTVVLVFWWSGFGDAFSLFSDQTAQVTEWAGTDLATWTLLGAICGLLGCMFIAAVDHICKLRNRYLRRTLARSEQCRRRFLMVAAFTTVVAPITYLELIYYDKFEDLSHNPHALVDHMFKKTVYGLSWHLVLYVPLKLLATLLSITQPLPVGLFSPVFLIGGAIGRVFGEALRYLSMEHGLLHISYEPWEFALIGSAAFSAGVTRALSTAVIVFELSGNNHLRLPLGVALLCAYYIGNRFTKGVYETLIDTNGVPYLTEMPREAFTIPAEEVMVAMPNLPYLALDSTQKEAQALLQTYPEYPVIPVVQGRRDMTLVGAVLSHDLGVALTDYEEKAKLMASDPVILGHSVSMNMPYTPPGDMALTLPGCLDPSVQENGNDYNRSPELGNHPSTGSLGSLMVDSNGSLSALEEQAIAEEQSEQSQFRGSVTPQQGSRARRRGREATTQQPGMMSPASVSPSGLRQGGYFRGSMSKSTSINSDVNELDGSGQLHFIVIKEGHKFATVACPGRAGKLMQTGGLPLITVVLDPSPYSMSNQTELQKVDLVFRMLKLDHAFITRAGRLVGILTREHLREFIGEREKLPIDECYRLCMSVTEMCLDTGIPSSYAYESKV